MTQTRVNSWTTDGKNAASAAECSSLNLVRGIPCHQEIGQWSSASEVGASKQMLPGLKSPEVNKINANYAHQSIPTTSNLYEYGARGKRKTLWSTESTFWRYQTAYRDPSLYDWTWFHILFSQLIIKLPFLLIFGLHVVLCWICLSCISWIMWHLEKALKWLGPVVLKKRI